MKTIIINGSPRKKGGTAAILSALRSQLQGEIIQIDTYTAKISPCIDCRYCWTHAACAIDDEMQHVYQQINQADTIILASPIYFGEITGSLLNFASRLQFFWTAKHFKNQPVLQKKVRKGAVILVDGGEGNKEQALAMGKRLLKIMGAEFQKQIHYSGTDQQGRENPMNDPDIVAAVKELACLCNQ